MRPCLTCGEPTAGTWCEQHSRTRGPWTDHDTTSAQRGYDNRWRRLSERARQLQPWCSDCGTSEDLTGDHRRWPARTLRDVDVVCRACNSRRGPLRGPRGRTPDAEASRPVAAARNPVTHENGSQ